MNFVGSERSVVGDVVQVEGRKKMCSPGWPRTRDPPASASFSKPYRRAPPLPARERRDADVLEPAPA